MTEPTSLQRVHAAGTNRLWLPGLGDTDLHVRAVSRALNEYDERLILGRHNETGDWCVFLKGNPLTGERGVPFPVLGLGRGDLPSAEEVMDRVRKNDTVRYGEKMLEEINKHNEAIQNHYKAAADEASGVQAEAMESFLHGMGRTPYLRSLRPIHRSAIKK